jgi:hypothetical protein
MMTLHDYVQSTLQDEIIEVDLIESVKNHTKLLTFIYDQLNDKPGSIGYKMIHWFAHKTVFTVNFDWDKNRQHVVILNVK